MPNVKVYDMSGNDAGTKDLTENIFDAKINKALLHSVVRAYLLNQRLGTHSTLTRAEVRGGGRKPWRQKGTGRARQGSTRSPQWTHGGVAFGPKPRCYRIKLNKKLKRLALKSALSIKASNDSIIVVDDIKLEEIKTKSIVAFLNAIGVSGKALIVTPEVNDIIVRSSKNIRGIKTTFAPLINTYDIMNAQTFVVDKAALPIIEEVFA